MYKELKDFYNLNFEGSILDNVKEKPEYQIGDNVWFYDFSGIIIKSEIVSKVGRRYMIDEPYYDLVTDYMFTSKAKALLRVASSKSAMNPPKSLNEWRATQVRAIVEQALDAKKITKEESVSFQSFLYKNYPVKKRKVDYFLVSDFAEFARQMRIQNVHD